ncbi:hypothetical protein PIB30_067789, partial [Stylosanthes scabra]|nr:hypothetical protein [Stylosanthes scabra]
TAEQDAVVVVFRNHEGKVLFASSSNITSYSVLAAEAIVAREALKMAKLHHINNLIVESDSRPHELYLSNNITWRWEQYQPHHRSSMLAQPDTEPPTTAALTGSTLKIRRTHRVTQSSLLEVTHMVTLNIEDPLISTSSLTFQAEEA